MGRMATLYYRFMCDVQERNQLVAERMILTTNPRYGYETWYTPTRYDDPLVAQRELALPASNAPIYRIGPIPEDLIKNLTVGPRLSPPANGHPGGGIEIATRECGTKGGLT
jgi:hypothetical protein